MQKITTFLWYDGKADEAAEFYVSVFKNARIISKSRGGDGKVFSVTFELEGQEFIALNGGPHYKFTPAISLFVKCTSQQEVDELWDKLLSDGGVPNKCGWLQDKYGLSWQIIPTALGQMLQDKDPAKAKRTMNAMLQMVKIDLAGLTAAYEGR